MKQAIDKSLVTWRIVDEALYIGENSPYGARLHKDGNYVPDDLYIDACSEVGTPKRKINKFNFRKILNEGGSIIFNRMESVSWPIREINTAISSYVGEDTCSNGYISFGGGDALSNHWDTHDVFATQLIGKKLWRIYGVTQNLPLANHKSTNHKQECPTSPMMELVLEAGDVLYLPRGWWHSAHPLPNVETFHLAVGVHPTMPEHYLGWLMNRVLQDELSYRQSIRLNEGKPNLEDLASAISNAVLCEENFDTFIQRKRIAERVFSNFNIANLVRENSGLSPLASRYSLNSKLLPEHHIQSEIINGVHLPRENSVGWTLLNLLASSQTALSILDIGERLPHLQQETIMTTLTELMNLDIITIRANHILKTQEVISQLPSVLDI